MIILFLIMIFYSFKLLKWAWYSVKAINSDIAWALLVSIICYFIGTISGRSLYPTSHNMFLFPVIALMVNYLRCKNEGVAKMILHGEKLVSSNVKPTKNSFLFLEQIYNTLEDEIKKDSTFLNYG